MEVPCCGGLEIAAKKDRHWRTVDYGIYGIADIDGNTERFGKIVCGAERNESCLLYTSRCV